VVLHREPYANKERKKDTSDYRQSVIGNGGPFSGLGSHKIGQLTLPLYAQMVGFSTIKHKRIVNFTMQCYDIYESVRGFGVVFHLTERHFYRVIDRSFSLLPSQFARAHFVPCIYQYRQLGCGTADDVRPLLSTIQIQTTNQPSSSG
jgi:hypothetical protein